MKSKSNEAKPFNLTSAQDIRDVFQSRDESILQQGLTALRDRLTLKYNERVDVHDPRLQLLSTWLGSDEGAQTLFRLWEVTNVKQHVVLSLIVSILGNTISLLSSHYSYHDFAAPIVNTILSQQWILKLNTYLASTYNDLIIFTLKLYLSLSNFSSGRVRKTLLDEFAWDLKTLPKLLHMRRKQKGDTVKNIMASPDIRSLFVLFLLSFVDKSSAPTVKNSFLEQRRDLLASAFKGLTQDPYPLVRKVLEILWDGMWSDSKVKRSLKVAVFNENTISQIVRLYDRKTQEGPDEDDVPAEVAHHFLLAICTRPGSGICFKDNGWYPREEGQSAGIPFSTTTEGTKVHNKILAGVVKSLRLSDDPRQRELALRILRACPELVAGFWSASSLTLEPRLSSTWIGNISFLNSVISELPPTDTFLKGGEYRSVPPPLNAVLDNIVPTSQIKHHLSRGLQSPSPLVQHCTALTVSKCLTKYLSVIQAFRSIQEILQEDITGLWTRRISEIEREVRRRLPDLQVIVAFIQQRGSGSIPSTSQLPINPVQADLLVESSQRLLWLYHHALPSLFAESRFDVAKVLQVLDSTEGGVHSQNIPGLLTVRQLHALRLLKESDQFSWSGKADSNRSNFSTLLNLYVATDITVIRATVGDVLKDGLAASLLFQHNPDEFSLWLDSLPTYFPGAERKDDDADPTTVIPFLDECSQRCLKTPFKYLEELRTLAGDHDELSSDTVTSSIQPELLPSPLLITVVEQFTLRITGDKLKQQETLSLVSYLRRLLLRLTCSVRSLEILHPLVERLLAATSMSNVAAPIQRELYALCLGTRYPRLPSLQNIDELSSRDLVGMPQNIPLRVTRTYLFPEFDPVLPFQGHLWTPDDVSSRLAQYTGSASCWLILVHSVGDILNNDAYHEVLTDLFAGNHCNLIEFKRSLAVINQRLMDPIQICNRTCTVSFLAKVISKARVMLSPTDLSQLKQTLVLSTSIKEYSSRFLAAEQQEAFANLIKISLDPASPEDKKLVTEYASYWCNLLQTKWNTFDELKAKTASIWIPFMTSEMTLSILQHLVGGDLTSDKHSSMVIEEILKASSGARIAFSQHISTFARLQSLFPNNSLVEAILADTLEETVGFLRPTDGSTLSQSLAGFDSRNSRARSQVRDLDVASILRREMWTPSTARILVSLIYLDKEVRKTVIQWLETTSFSHDASYLATIIHALIDCSPLDCSVTVEILPYFKTLVQLVVEQRDSTVTTKSTEALILALRYVPSLREQLITILRDEFTGFAGIWDQSIATLCKAAVDAAGEDLAKSLENVVSDGWKWATSLLTEPVRCSTKECSTLMLLVDLLKHSRAGSSVHSLADTAVSAAIQHHLTEKKIVQFIHRTVECLQLKPASTNRILQSIIQHPRFYDSCQINNDGLREDTVALLHFLFHLHPANTCQPSHLEPFSRLYGGTLSPSDLKLLSIFRLYETTRKASLAGLLARPSHDAVDASHSLLSLDSGRVLRTCLSFPQWRGMYAPADNMIVEEAEVYDPTYIILLFGFWMKDEAPSSALAWVRMFRTNVVSLLIRSLSSHEETTRQAALSQLASLSILLQDADFAEQKHVLLVMDLLRDQVRIGPTDLHSPRLPAYMTLHLAHSLRGIFYPSHFIYPLTARYLLQRPELDSTDVPMLLSMLYSSDDQWKPEQLWILRFLTDGLVGKKEWQIMSKRHTWDLVASQYRRMTDKMSRHAVLELLARISSLPSPTYTLITKSALLEWIEEQLRYIIPGEEIAWLKIIENIVVMMNSARSASRNQEWQHAVARCLLKVLQSHSCQNDDLSRTIAILRRLDVTVLIPSQVSSIITSALSKLQNTEIDLVIPVDITEHLANSQLPPSNPPHRSGRLWTRTQPDPFLLWGQTVEALWQVSLEAENSQQWNELTNRLLLWRAVVGEENSRTGEWARRQMIEALSVQ